MARQQVIDDFSLSDDVVQKLDILVSELERWQRIKNLVGPATLDQVWSRHIADSLQLHRLTPEAKMWLDVGSGAGFPGLVLGILGSEAGFKVTLVESNGRKCSFLHHVARLTCAPVTIHTERLEVVIPKMVGRVDVFTARALASLDQLLTWGEPLFEQGTIGLFPKGRDVASELQLAERHWQITYDMFPSLVDSDSSILRITSLSKLTV